MTEQQVLQKVRRELGKDIFNALGPEYFIEIINDESLYTWSVLYPFIIRGIVITAKNAIKSVHPQTGRTAYYKYKIPMENPEDEIIGVENWYYNGNNSYGGYFGMVPTFTEAMMGKFASLTPTSGVKYSIHFYPPDIVQIDPIPRNHMDFALDVERKRHLHEIPLYYREYFLQLCVCDIKWTIYNEMKALREGQQYHGLEVNSYVGDYSDAKSDRENLLELLRKDYYKDPERFRSFVQFSY